MAFVILSIEIVYESKKCLVKSETDARKRAKKVSRITLQSIT